MRDYFLGLNIVQRPLLLYYEQSLQDHLHQHIPGSVRFLASHVRQDRPSSTIMYYHLSTEVPLTEQMILAIPNRVDSLEFTVESFYSMHDKLRPIRTVTTLETFS
ncbi:MAG: hypothetical protein AABX72_02745 [Nanoarchaeota archaeon]